MYFVQEFYFHPGWPESADLQDQNLFTADDRVNLRNYDRMKYFQRK